MWHGKEQNREFPGGTAVRTEHFQCQGPGSIPGQGTKTPRAAKHSQKQNRAYGQKDSIFFFRRIYRVPKKPFRFSQI